METSERKGRRYRYSIIYARVCIQAIWTTVVFFFIMEEWPLSSSSASTVVTHPPFCWSQRHYVCSLLGIYESLENMNHWKINKGLNNHHLACMVKCTGTSTGEVYTLCWFMLLAVATVRRSIERDRVWYRKGLPQKMGSESCVPLVKAGHVPLFCINRSVLSPLTYELVSWSLGVTRASVLLLTEKK